MYKCRKSNDERPVEGSRKDTVLEREFVDEFKAIEMKKTSNCSGFNMTFQPSSDAELYLFTGKKVKNINNDCMAFLYFYPFYL